MTPWLEFKLIVIAVVAFFYVEECVQRYRDRKASEKKQRSALVRK